MVDESDGRYNGRVINAPGDMVLELKGSNHLASLLDACILGQRS